MEDMYSMTVEKTEKLRNMIDDDVKRMRKEAYDLQLILNTKPKGQMRELNKKMKQLGIDLSREEKNLSVVEDDLKGLKEKEAKKAAKKK